MKKVLLFLMCGFFIVSLCVSSAHALCFADVKNDAADSKAPKVDGKVTGDVANKLPDEGTGNICRDWKSRDGVLGTEKGNPDQAVVSFTMEQTNAAGKVVTTKQADIRCYDATVDLNAILTSLANAKVAVSADLQGKIQATLAAMAKDGTKVITFDDNEWGLVGVAQTTGTTKLLGVSKSMDGVVSRLHEIIEAGLRLGTISEADIVGTEGDSALVTKGVTLGQYAAKHAGPDARKHALARVLTYRSFPDEDLQLTKTIKMAMNIFAGKRLVREAADAAKAANKGEKTTYTVILPKQQGKSTTDPANWDEFKALSDVADVQHVYVDNAQAYVDAVKAAKGTVLAMVDGNISAGIASLSPADQGIIASVAQLNIVDLDSKITVKDEENPTQMKEVPIRGIAAGILLQIAHASKISNGKPLSAGHPIVTAIAAELELIRGDNGKPIELVDVVNLIPISNDVTALKKRLDAMAAWQLLPTAAPANWTLMYQQQILAGKTVDIAA